MSKTATNNDKQNAPVRTKTGYLGPFMGNMRYIAKPPLYRGTTVQVCGLYPFIVGSSNPNIGVPLGKDLISGGAVCADPISWFKRAHLISNPSLFVMGQPGLGKSTLIRRMVTGLAGYGIIPLILGDLKPDYVQLIKQLGGQVISLGAGGRGYLNVLDPGASKNAIKRLTTKGFKRQATQIYGDMQLRQLNMVASLLTIVRSGQSIRDRENNILSKALLILNDKFINQENPPLLKDLLEIIKNPPAELRSIALDRGDLKRYKQITEDLEVSLLGLISKGNIGEIFSQPTSEPMQIDKPVCYDISSIDDSQENLQAAALLSCWSNGFSNINISNTLADCGLEPRRHYFACIDEFWRVLKSGTGMVDRIDATTRLNRQRGFGQAYITHTPKDLESLKNDEDKQKAMGFIERSGMMIMGGLSKQDLEKLDKTISLSNVEKNTVSSWVSPEGWSKEATPPGRGKFLIKVGGRPGIPIKVQLTPAEIEVNDTNKLWT